MPKNTPVQASIGNGKTTAAGRPRASRASQFMPFAALTGYYELTRQQERIAEPKHELTDEEARRLSEAIESLQRRQIARVTYYDHDAYQTITGTVVRVDPIFRQLQIIRTTIDFDDLLEVIPLGSAACDNTI